MQANNYNKYISCVNKVNFLILFVFLSYIYQAPVRRDGMVFTFLIAHIFWPGDRIADNISATWNFNLRINLINFYSS